MIHLSVALGRFIEVLFWAIFRTAAWGGALALVAIVVLVGAIVGLRRSLRKPR